MLKKYLSIVMMCASLQSQLISGEQIDDFNYINVDGQQLKTSHDIVSTIQVNSDFNPLEPYRYQAEFHRRPFNVSLMTYIKDEHLLAIHAESLPDKSGVLDYSYMQPVTLFGIKMFYREHCPKLTEQDVSGAKDLAYFRANGFDFSPRVHLQQYFLHSVSGNSEIVITIATRYDERNYSCEPGKQKPERLNSFINSFDIAENK